MVASPSPGTGAAGTLAKRWPGASMWPNWDLLETADGPFSIEREARLHRQAAGNWGGGYLSCALLTTDLALGSFFF